MFRISIKASIRLDIKTEICIEYAVMTVLRNILGETVFFSVVSFIYKVYHMSVFVLLMFMNIYI